LLLEPLSKLFNLLVRNPRICQLLQQKAGPERDFPSFSINPDVSQAEYLREKRISFCQNIARLKWSDSALTVSAAAAEKGSVVGKVKAVTDDEPGRIAINISYLLEYLSGKEDYVEMGISSDKSPVLFKYHDSPAVVMMPMFVQWE